MILPHSFSGAFSWLCIFFVTIGHSAYSQENLFDASSSTRYGIYLVQTGKCEKALEEFGRALYLDGDNKQLKAYYLQALRCNKRYEEAITFYQKAFTPSDTAKQILRDYGMSLLRTSQWEKLDSLTGQIASDDLVFMRLASFGLRRSWIQADSVLAIRRNAISPSLTKDIEAVLCEGRNYRERNPVLSAGLSAIVPGSGKIYTGEWQDGLFALAAISAGTWQTYRQFNRNGSDSLLGWALLGFTSTFYISNIYGSLQSARKVNQKKKQIIQDKIHALLNTSYP